LARRNPVDPAGRPGTWATRAYPTSFIFFIHSRECCKITEPTVRLETEADVNVGLHDNNQNSQFACKNLNITQIKEDGDEHLPLAKRARVRMDKQLSLHEEHNNFT